MSTSVFDQARQRERDRLQALEDLFDPASRRQLAGRGIRPGWHCLEVGAGTGGIARWLAQQVGPGGQVVTTNLDPRFMDGDGPANLEVRQHDIQADPLPRDRFDLAHARAFLMHLPARQQALDRMLASVRPGGWVVIEEPDFSGAMVPALVRYTDPPLTDVGLWERVSRGVQASLVAAGADVGFGARLPRVLAEAGLEHVGAELHAPLHRGSKQDLCRLSIQRLRPRLVGSGMVSDEEVERILALTAQPWFEHLPFVMVSAWGHRPPARGQS
jgi:SAM-dependent methyltransferase